MAYYLIPAKVRKNHLNHYQKSKIFLIAVVFYFRMKLKHQYQNYIISRDYFDRLNQMLLFLAVNLSHTLANEEPGHDNESYYDPAPDY